MAYKITDFTRSVAPTTPYPYGDVKDDPGGTLVNRLAMNDVWQNLQEIMNFAGITPNSTPDNAINGYQIFQALQNLVQGNFKSFGGAASGAWTNAGTPSIAHTGGGFGLGTVVYNRYKTFGNLVAWQMYITGNVIGGTPSGPTKLTVTAPSAFAGSGGAWSAAGLKTFGGVLDDTGASAPNQTIVTQLVNPGGVPSVDLYAPASFPVSTVDISMNILAEFS